MTFKPYYSPCTHYATFIFDNGQPNEVREIKYFESYGTLPYPQKEGYLFDGWYLEKEFKTEITELSLCRGDVTLYAKWVLPQYKVYFQTIYESIKPMTFNKGDKLTNLPSSSMPGYTFSHWVDENNNKITNETVINEDMYLKEVLIPNVYNITYHNGTTTTQTTYTYATKFILEDACKKGYDFDGWYLDKEFKTKVTSIENITEDIDLYAKFTKVKVSKPLIKKIKKKSNKVTLSFKGKNVDGYKIYYSTNKSFKNKKTLSTTKSNLKLKLKNKKTYYVKIKAYKLDSTNKKVYSKYSSVKKIKL